MRGKFRRVVAMLLIVAMCLGTFSSCGSSEEANAGVSVEYLTRAEWIAMLGERFSMSDYINEEPYYNDVNSDSEIFPYVQSCYEWGVISTGTESFKPDDVATFGFVITTSVLAADIDYSQYMTSDDVNEGIINAANAAGISDIKYSDSEKLKEGVCLIDASNILSVAVSQYLKMDTEDDHVTIEYTDAVIDKTDNANIVLNEDRTQLTMPQSEAESVEVGQILMVDDVMYSDGYAVKVVSKEVQPDGTVSIKVERPEIYEVLDEVDIDTYVMAGPENFTPAEGVTIVDDVASVNNISPAVYTTQSGVDNLMGNESRTDQTVTGTASASKSITLNINLTDGKSELVEDETLDGCLEEMGRYLEKLGASSTTSQELASDEGYEEYKTIAEGSRISFDYDRMYYNKMGELADQYQAGEITEEEFMSQLDQYKQTIEEGAEPKYQYEAGYAITGTMKLEVGAEAKVKIDFDWFDTELKEVSLAVSSKATNTLKVAGKIEGSSKIGSFVIPVGGGFDIEVAAYLYAEANGELSLTYEVVNTSKIEYTSSSGYKSSEESSESSTLEAKLSLEAGLKLSAVLEFWGIEIADVALSVGIMIEASAKAYAQDGYTVDNTNNTLTIYEELGFGTEVNLYLPIIKIKIGDDDDTLLAELGISKEITLVAQTNAKMINLYDLDRKIRYEETIDLNQEEETTTPAEGETTSGQQDNEYSGPVYLDEFVVVVYVGESKELSYVLSDDYTAEDLVWSSDDEMSATVANGTVTGVSEGSAVITLTTADGKWTTTCTVVVKEK